MRQRIAGGARPGIAMLDPGRHGLWHGAVVPLTEREFAAIVDAGCLACNGKKLAIDALVSQKLPLLGGEPFGPPSWAYKGEDLVAGTFRIACLGCKAELFTATDCPRCRAPDGVARALDTESTISLPEARCDGCGSEQATATAVVPVTVVYEGTRAQKPRGRTAPQDPGFHALQVECKRCFASLVPRRAAGQPCLVCGA